MLRSIVVVGGGTAGWITAGLLAAKYAKGDNPALSVTLVESPNVPTIGVGEGTWPTMVNTLRKLGISETEFLQNCDASFKQASKFQQWVTGKAEDAYYHPFSMPQGFDQVNLVPQWQRSHSQTDFAFATSLQAELCERKLAPKPLDSAEYATVENHGYHLDAGKFTQLLTKHCTENLAVNHILADVEAIATSSNGDIEQLATKQGNKINGDLFIDCTGFAALLIGKHYQVPFICKKDSLFIDTAIAVQVPYKSANQEIESATLSTAQTAGWIWDIGLPTRRGVGHVFSSKYIDKEKALEQLKNYVAKDGTDPESLNYREIKINPGYREKFWVNNCVAVGMSAGFLEPLEASALVMIELAANTIAAHLPAHREAMDTVAEQYNQNFRFRWEKVIDFLKLHYVLSKRDDSEFWRDNRKPETISHSLQQLLKLWKHQSPSNNGFFSPYDLFPAASYQYILYGMGFETNECHLDSSPAQLKLAEEMLTKVATRKHKVLAALPSNREFLNSIRAIVTNGELDLATTHSTSWASIPESEIANYAHNYPLLLKENGAAVECIALLGFAQHEQLLPVPDIDQRQSSDTNLKLLKQLEVMEPVNLDVTFTDHSRIMLKGLQVVNQELLQKLSADQVKLLESSSLPLTIKQMSDSLRHIPTLIELKNNKN